MKTSTPIVSRTVALVAILVAAVSGACAIGDVDPDAEFESLTFRVTALGGREVRLQDREASLTEEGVQVLLDDLHLTGILDASRGPVTTGILYVVRTRAEPATELVVVQEEDGSLAHVSSHPLGGGMRIEGIRYEEGRIVVHVLDYDPDDPPCCPSLPSERRFILDGTELREVDGTPPS
jgi:hypothetical protein